MSAVLTHDGVWLVRDITTGVVASGRTYFEACAELRRLLGARQAA